MVKVTLVEAGGGILGNFDRALADYYASHMQKRGVHVMVQTAVKSIEESYDADGHHTTHVELSDGSQLPFGALVWSAGVTRGVAGVRSRLRPELHARVASAREASPCPSQVSSRSSLSRTASCPTAAATALPSTSTCACLASTGVLPSVTAQ